MIDYIKIAVILLLYFILFWSFGYGFNRLVLKEERETGITLVTGFFAYYVVFQVVAVPFMFAQRRLSELTVVWAVLAALVCMVCAWMKVRQLRQKGRAEGKNLGNRKREPWDVFWRAVPFLVAAANILFVSIVYSNDWDATYYVGNVSFAVYTGSINTINPLTGTVLDYFDLKHCLATYHVNDAIICQIFGVHPLIETKTIMVIVVTVILNLVYYQYAKFLFEDSVRGRGLFMGFAFLVNLCTYTAYTSSSFILLRTYEGKAVTGAVTAMMLLYCFLRLWKKEERTTWALLFVTAWGAAAISSSAIFLVILALGVFAVVQIGRKRQLRYAVWCGICMAPAGIMLLCYLFNRLGILNIPVAK